MGIDPALAKVHSTYLPLGSRLSLLMAPRYEGKREKIAGSSLTTMATPTISARTQKRSRSPPRSSKVCAKRWNMQGKHRKTRRFLAVSGRNLKKTAL